jgi:hypothetical protein
VLVAARDRLERLEEFRERPGDPRGRAELTVSISD